MEKEIAESYLGRVEEVLHQLFRRLHADLVHHLLPGITGSQFIVLKNINKKGRITVSEVAESLGVSLSAITALVDRLFKAGFVVRRRDENDRRLVWLELTGEGEDMLESCQKSRRKVIGKYLSQLPDEDLEKMVSICENLLNIINKD